MRILILSPDIATARRQLVTGIFALSRGYTSYHLDGQVCRIQPIVSQDRSSENLAGNQYFEDISKFLFLSKKPPNAHAETPFHSRQEQQFDEGEESDGAIPPESLGLREVDSFQSDQIGQFDVEFTWLNEIRNNDETSHDAKRRRHVKFIVLALDSAPEIPSMETAQLEQKISESREKLETAIRNPSSGTAGNHPNTPGESPAQGTEEPQADQKEQGSEDGAAEPSNSDAPDQDGSSAKDSRLTDYLLLHAAADICDAVVVYIYHRGDDGSLDAVQGALRVYLARKRQATDRIKNPVVLAMMNACERFAYDPTFRDPADCSRAERALSVAGITTGLPLANNALAAALNRHEAERRVFYEPILRDHPQLANLLLVCTQDASRVAIVPSGVNGFVRGFLCANYDPENPNLSLFSRLAESISASSDDEAADKTVGDFIRLHWIPYYTGDCLVEAVFPDLVTEVSGMALRQDRLEKLLLI